MRARRLRHLGSLAREGLDLAGAEVEFVSTVVKKGLPPRAEVSGPPVEFTWHDRAVFLLHVAAEIEHSLMVQYLYAAWSMGGAGVPPERAAKVCDWQTVILGIAKEEMGHLVTVQNLLRLIGGPLNFEREDYPFRSEFYPFRFTLERLSLDSLAKYVLAEAPTDWEEGELSERIRQRAKAANEGAVTSVAKLYQALIAIFKNELRERDFLPRSLLLQASWNEWGRGYRAGERGQSAGQEAESPDVLVLSASSRDQAVDALERIARQGEAPEVKSDSGEKPPDSHFARFLGIYEELEGAPFEVSRPVATNPKTDELAREVDDPSDCGVITDPQALGWAHLFNLRYRLLLVDLVHALGVAGPAFQGAAPTVRGSLVNWTFGEMYNLRAVAAILMQHPLEEGGEAGVRAAGPPFEMPYTLSLPETAEARWRLHRDLLEAARLAIDPLLQQEPAEQERDYLLALRRADQIALGLINQLIGSAAREPLPS